MNAVGAERWLAERKGQHDYAFFFYGFFSNPNLSSLDSYHLNAFFSLPWNEHSYIKKSKFSFNKI